MRGGAGNLRFEKWQFYSVVLVQFFGSVPVLVQATELDQCFGSVATPVLYTVLEVRAMLSESEQNRVICRIIDTVLQISENQHYYCNTKKKCHKFSIANTHGGIKMD